jgi:hypothetical protein
MPGTAAFFTVRSPSGPSQLSVLATGKRTVHLGAYASAQGLPRVFHVPEIAHLQR